MISKFLLVVVVIGLVYFLFIKKKPALKKPKKKDVQAETMVECKKCGTFVSPTEAILSSGEYFCSSECLRA